MPVMVDRIDRIVVGYIDALGRFYRASRGSNER